MINTYYNIFAGIYYYYLFVGYLCLRPSGKFLPLIVMSSLSFNNMIDFKTYLLFCGEKSLGKTGLKVSCMFICSISYRDTVFPYYPHFLIPSLKLSCFMQIAASCE